MKVDRQRDCGAKYFGAASAAQSGSIRPIAPWPGRAITQHSRSLSGERLCCFSFSLRNRRRLRVGLSGARRDRRKSYRVRVPCRHPFTRRPPSHAYLVPARSAGSKGAVGFTFTNAILAKGAPCSMGALISSNRPALRGNVWRLDDPRSAATRDSSGIAPTCWRKRDRPTTRDAGYTLTSKSRPML